MTRALSALFALALSAPAAAQDDRLAELEARVAELEEEVLLEEEDETYGLGLEFRSGDVGAVFQIFGDVGASYENPDPPGRGNSQFASGGVDFFTNVRFGERFRILSETVVDVRSDDSTSLSQERLSAMWVFSDALYAKIGTEHSPISRWNQLNHHGSWLETSIEKPSMVQFEGGTGILPLHRTGVEFGGSHVGDRGRTEYFATVSNGRGEDPRDKQRGGDVNDRKAIDVGVAYSPSSNDLRVGAAFVWDDIPVDPDSPDPARMRSMREWIATFHVEYTAGRIDALAEYAYIRHEPRAAGFGDYGSNAGYVHLEMPGEEWTPYTRFDYRNMDEGDPFYGPLDRDLDLWSQTLGVRWDLTENLAVKVEGAAGRVDERVGGGISGQNLYTAGLQVSWWL